MATAWEILRLNSPLPTGTAWDHLNAQEGGGSVTYHLLQDGLEIEMDDGCFDVEIDNNEIEVLIDDSEVIVEIDSDEIEVEICNV